MSAQEASWYLLRQQMSHSSRRVTYIPTLWPQERYKSRKRKSQLDKENISDDSTEVWTKNIIQRYEDRPLQLEHIYLAEYSAWYDYQSYEEFDEEDELFADYERPYKQNSKKRIFSRVIRYRNYDIEDLENFKREMVLLYIPFRNEIVDILDSKKFLIIYDDRKEEILQRHQLYISNINRRVFVYS